MEANTSTGFGGRLISLFAAFVFTPWLDHIQMAASTMSHLQVAERNTEAEGLEGLYRKLLTL